jgi:dihydroorotate dehydrogenase (NAD+) catalytic subunit
MVWQVAQAVKIPVIGIGGIMSANDAVEYLLAGASAVEIGTGNFIDPSLVASIFPALCDYCRNNKIESIDDFHRFIQ